MNAVIRPALPSDAPACAKIYAPFVTDSWVSFETEVATIADMEQRIAEYGKTHAWLIAEWENDIAGYAYASPHRTRAAYATSVDVAVYVDPAFARKGIGRALYKALFQNLKKAGFHAAFAGIALPNKGSIGLHEDMGFKPVGIYREVGWKMDAWRDVGWWQRLL